MTGCYCNDGSVHRCGECGMWCVGSKPCTTCALVLARQEAS